MAEREPIRRFIASRFGNTFRGDLKEHDPLFSSGIIDSFGVLELIAFLEDTFRITIDPSQYELIEFDTIEKIADIVARARASSQR